MRIVFSKRAENRLRQIHTTIAQDNPISALKVTSRIRQVIELLAEFPYIGREWGDGSSRAMTVSGLPYRIHYRINPAADALEVITIVHTRMRSADL
ncbi:MAG: hypothetical protein GKR94_09500 [Gammaproteobacteria bacterium]|nr:hypothetical protein [Gammaproteobacteria bacterium]